MKHPAASCGVSGEILRSRYPPSPQPSPRFRWAAEASAKAARLRRVLPPSSPSKLRCIRGRRINDRECRSSSQRGGSVRLSPMALSQTDEQCSLMRNLGTLAVAVPEIRTLSKDQFLPAPTSTGGRGVSPMCRRWSNSRIGYEGFWKPRPCSRILRAQDNQQAR
jgi:hypothetical protein